MLTAALFMTVALAAPADEPNVELKPITKGASAKLPYYKPQRATFGEAKPEGLTKAPADLAAPVYGVLPIGDGVIFILDEPDGKPAKLYVDSNDNGNLTDDGDVEWVGKENKSGDTVATTYRGSAKVDVGTDAKPSLVTISVYRFDKNDPSRVGLKSMLFYYRDYAYEGDVTIGGKKYHAMLVDDATRGDYSVHEDDAIRLMLDVDGDGKFGDRGESFDAGKPFNVAGTTYELANMAKDGSSFKVVKSAKQVEEVKPAPQHRTGTDITAFDAVDTGGKAVKFPGDYKGKVVLLDFWATWCGPCMKEMPNVVAAYEKYHNLGFEVLGVSLDSEKTVGKMPDVMKTAKMTWRQVCDGKGWQAAVAQKYGINSIPATFLVDGTTGKILGTNLRGEELARAVERALTSGGSGRASAK